MPDQPAPTAALRNARPDEPFTATTGTVRARPEPTLANALSSLAMSYAGDPRDWGVYYRDAWTYGIVCGWECEDDDPAHEHDDICGGDAAMREAAGTHRWRDEDVAWLRAARAAYREAEGV